MPFPIVHLYIAGKILSAVPDTVIPRDFYIGSLAPDSVHFRPNYSGAYKVKSHICIDAWKWGESTDNHAWKENVIRFFKKTRNTMNYSFICGYCAHILADAAWNEKFWLPFRARHNFSSENLNGSGLHRDCREIDTRLFHRMKDKEKIKQLLEDCFGLEITGIVFESEIVKMIESLLHEQFEKRPINEEYVFRYVNIEQVENFIEDESVRIAAQLFGGIAPNENY